MTTKTRDLRAIADLLIAKGERASYYDKAAQPRIYLNGYGWSTKKMRTKVWLQLNGDAIAAHCRVECDSQPREWTESQEAEVLAGSRLTALVRWLNIYHIAPTGDAAANAEQVIEDNTLLDTIYGVVPEWREVRVSINRYGKLATRNRLFLRLWKGTKIEAPRKLEEISEGMYRIAANRWQHGEKMCRPAAQSEAVAEVLGRLAFEVEEVGRMATNN